MTLALIDPYQGLAVEDADWLRKQTDAIMVLFRRSVEDMVLIGRIITEVKSRLVHGTYGLWISTCTDMSIETARKYMLVAAEWETQNPTGLEIEPQALHLLWHPNAPPEGRTLALRLAGEGHTIDASAARRILKEIKPGPPVMPRAAQEAHAARKASSFEQDLKTLYRFGPQTDPEIRICERLDPEGYPIFTVWCGRQHEESRVLSEALHLLAIQVEAIPSGPPAVEYEPHRNWARLIGVGVAGEYGLKDEERQDIESAAVLHMMRAAHRFQPTSAPKAPCKKHGRGDCVECQFRGFAHLDIQKHCRREAHLPRNGGLYKTRRDPKAIVVGRFDENPEDDE